MDTEATVGTDDQSAPQFTQSQIGDAATTDPSATAPQSEQTQAPEQLAELQKERDLYKERYSQSSSEAKRLYEEAQRYKAALVGNTPQLDPAVQQQVDPYVRPHVDPMKERLENLTMYTAQLNNKVLFRDMLDDNPDLEPLKDKLWKLATRTSMSMDEIRDFGRDFVESAQQSNERVVSSRRSVRLEGSKFQTKEAPREKGVWDMSDQEFEAQYKDPNSSLRRATDAQAQELDRRY